MSRVLYDMAHMEVKWIYLHTCRQYQLLVCVFASCLRYIHVYTIYLITTVRMRNYATTMCFFMLADTWCSLVLYCLRLSSSFRGWLSCFSSGIQLVLSVHGTAVLFLAGSQLSQPSKKNKRQTTAPNPRKIFHLTPRSPRPPPMAFEKTEASCILESESKRQWNPTWVWYIYIDIPKHPKLAFWICWCKFSMHHAYLFYMPEPVLVHTCTAGIYKLYIFIHKLDKLWIVRV